MQCEAVESEGWPHQRRCENQADHAIVIVGNDDGILVCGMHRASAAASLAIREERPLTTSQPV